MIRLTLAEFKRLIARRMTLLFPAVLALLFVGGIAIAYFVISNDDENTPDFVNDIAGGPEATGILDIISALIALMAFVVGASSIGADIKTGMLEQLLTWEPRRLRLLVARSIAGFSGVAIAALIVSSIYVGLLYGLASLEGTTGGTSGEFWTNVLVVLLRTALAAGLFTVFGIGVTLIVNSSVGSIVGFVVYFFIIENIVSLLLRSVSVYLPLQNLTAFAAGTDVERLDGSAFVENPSFVTSHGWVVAGLILAGWTVLAAVGAAVVFTRRDVD